MARERSANGLCSPLLAPDSAMLWPGQYTTVSLTDIGTLTIVGIELGHYGLLA
jgi:hypothetical protein